MSDNEVFVYKLVVRIFSRCLEDETFTPINIKMWVLIMRFRNFDETRSVICQSYTLQTISRPRPRDIIRQECDSIS